jgi:cytidylate kinase
MGRIVIISGSPGSGKSTITQILAENSPYEKTVHIHTDDFYKYICKGYIEPWQNGAGEQNATVLETIALCAKSFADGGYEVFVDGVIGPWFINPWVKLARDNSSISYRGWS